MVMASYVSYGILCHGHMQSILETFDCIDVYNHMFKLCGNFLLC